MKKFLLTCLVGLFAVCAFAQKTYTDNLVVTINEESTEPMPADIIVEQQADGTYNLSLLKFALVAGEDVLPVGNINLKGITMNDENGVKTFETKQTILIEPGDENAETWIGPMLGEVPIDLKGKMTSDKLYCTIDIDMMESLGQIIQVTFGTDIEIPAGPAVVFTYTFNDNLVVTINEESTEPMPAEIKVDVLEDGTYTLSLKQFALVAGEDVLPVGNITLKGITMNDENGVKTFETQQTILIEPGDENAETWIGPMLGEVPIDLKGKMTSDKLYCTIDIDMMESLGQIIQVTFGTDIEIPTVPAVIFTYTFNDNLVVTINEESTEPMPAEIKVEVLEDGTYTLSLKQFALVAGEDVLPVGNITLKGITMTDDAVEPYKNFSTQQTILIEPGDENADMWVGPMLGEVPIDLKGKMTSDKLYCTIDIDMMESLGQIIQVTFGTDFIPSAIEGIAAGSGMVDVYTLNGVRLRTAPVQNALQGLPSGIYVVGGKKMVK